MLHKLLLTACCLVPAQLVSANSVQLISSDNLMNVNGEILSYEDGVIKIKSNLGVLSFPISDVTCIGDTCPQSLVDEPEQIAATPLSYDIRVAAGADDVQILAGLYNTVSQASVSQQNEGAFSVQMAHGIDEVKISFAGEADISDGNISISPSSYSAETIDLLNVASAWQFDGRQASQIVNTGALVVIAAPNVDIDAISLDDLARIFAGDVKDWSEIGGTAGPIMPLKQPPQSREEFDFQQMVMEPAGLDLSDQVLTMPSGEQIANMVGQLPGSIAVVDLVHAAEKQQIPVLGQCGDRVSADAFSITSGDYPLLRTITAEMVDGGDVLAASKFFETAATFTGTLDAGADNGVMMLSADNKKARINGILGADAGSVDPESARNMVQALFASNRMSVTFQDNAITKSAHAWNRTNMERLKSAILSGQFDGSEITFVGFSSDGYTDPRTASELSANEVMQAFKTFAPELWDSNTSGIEFRAQGFGATSPIACHDSLLTSVNGNRVEIWLKPIKG